MSEKPVVAVLMSVYNGEKYLGVQIDSILNQKDVEVHLYIRNDGSKDTSGSIIESYDRTCENIHIVPGNNNLNYAKSFLTLLLSVEYADYYAFADQDDYWESNKLISAIKMLQNSNTNSYLVYASALEIVDEDLEPISLKTFEKRKFTFGSVLSRQGLAGCTMVFDYYYAKCIKNYVKLIIEEFPLNFGHDGWIVLLCLSMGGSVVVDNESYIKYRRHTGTITNSGGGIKKRIKSEWKIFLNQSDARQKVVKFLVDNLQDSMTDDIRMLCDDLVSYRHSFSRKIKLIASGKLKTGIKIVDLKNSIAIFANKY